MKSIKLLITTILLLSMFSITGCKLNESSNKTSSGTSEQSNNNDSGDTTLPANNGSGDVYIIDDGSNVINNQRIEQNSVKPGK